MILHIIYVKICGSSVLHPRYFLFHQWVECSSILSFPGFYLLIQMSSLSRVGGRENFFHCEKCDMCLSVEVKKTHKVHTHRYMCSRFYKQTNLVVNRFRRVYICLHYNRLQGWSSSRIATSICLTIFAFLKVILER